MLGWAFGQTAMIALGHVRRYEKDLIAIILLAVVVIFWVMRKRHVEDEVVVVLAAGDTGPIPKISQPND
jgi:Ca2+/Na+ antiporter